MPKPFTTVKGRGQGGWSPQFFAAWKAIGCLRPSNSPASGLPRYRVPKRAHLRIKKRRGRPLSLSGPSRPHKAKTNFFHRILVGPLAGVPGGKAPWRGIQRGGLPFVSRSGYSPLGHRASGRPVHGEFEG